MVQMALVRVLTTIFTDTGNVPFDVTRVEVGLVEGGIEQQDQAFLFVDQATIDALHGHLGTLNCSGTGEN